VHDYRAGGSATHSPLVSIHHIGVMLSGVCLRRIKGLACVKGAELYSRFARMKIGF